jgi:hypothetical protein
MDSRQRISCPGCGAPMNRHAEKLDTTVIPDQTDPSDLGLGGVVEEFHTCPGCKFIVKRLAGAA